MAKPVSNWDASNGFPNANMAIPFKYQLYQHLEYLRRDVTKAKDVIISTLLMLGWSVAVLRSQNYMLQSKNYLFRL